MKYQNLDEIYNELLRQEIEKLSKEDVYYYIQLNEKSDNKPLWVDTETGEVVHIEYQAPKRISPPRIHTKPDLAGICSKSDLADYFKNSSDNRNKADLGPFYCRSLSWSGIHVQSLDEWRDELRLQQKKVFDQICKLVKVRSVVFTSTSELSGLTGVSSRKVSEAVSHLAKHGYIRVLKRNAGGRGNYMIEVHPVWVWIGEDRTRQARLDNFYRD